MLTLRLAYVKLYDCSATAGTATRMVTVLQEKLDFGEAQRTLNLSLSLTCSPAENQRVSGKFCDCCERSCSPLVADARNSNEPTASQSEASDSIPADVHLVNLINYVCHPKTLQCIRNLMIEDRLPA